MIDIGIVMSNEHDGISIWAIFVFTFEAKQLDFSSFYMFLFLSSSKVAPSSLRVHL